MRRTVETREEVEVEYGERGPIVDVDHELHGRTAGFYEVVRVVRTLDGDGDRRIIVYGLPVRADGERKASSVYPIPIYGDQVDTAAAEILDAAAIRFGPDRFGR